MVDLVGLYSKETEQIKRVQKTLRLSQTMVATRPVASAVATIGRCKLSFRLSAADRDALVRDYQTGATGRELAERYGLARSTVILVVKEAGVTVRHPRISRADASLAVELYQQGVQQIDIAERLGRSKSVVWHLLRRAGLV